MSGGKRIAISLLGGVALLGLSYGTYLVSYYSPRWLADVFVGAVLIVLGAVAANHLLGDS